MKTRTPADCGSGYELHIAKLKSARKTTRPFRYDLNQIPYTVQFSSVAQSCTAFAIPWTAAHKASLSITNSQSLLKLMSIESVMPSNYLILCFSLLLPSIFPSIRVFSNTVSDVSSSHQVARGLEFQLQHQSLP